MLLLRAGDVEANPGTGPCCKPCGSTLSTNQPHLKCGSCIATFHKQEKCSGLRRVSQTPGNWTCIDCIPPRYCTPPLPSTVSTLVGQPIGTPRLSGTCAPQKRCMQCEKVVRYSPHPLVCVGCQRTCHLKLLKYIEWRTKHAYIHRFLTFLKLLDQREQLGRE